MEGIASPIQYTGTVTRLADSDGAADGAIELGEAGDAAVVAACVAVTLTVGDTLMLGERGLRIGALLRAEPDRDAGFVSFAPRVLMAEADLASIIADDPAQIEARDVGQALALVVSKREGFCDRQRFRNACGLDQ